MKTVLLVTGSTQSHRVLAGLLGETVNLLPVAPPAEMDPAAV